MANVDELKRELAAFLEDAAAYERRAPDYMNGTDRGLILAACLLEHILKQLED